jgi:O-antigen ligase
MLRGLPIAMIVFGVAMLRLKFSGALYADGRLSSSGTYDPNDVALVAACCFPFSTMLLSDRSRAWRWIGLAGVVMSLMIVVLSASRGGVLALGAVLVFAIFGTRRNLPRRWKTMIIPVTVVAIYFAPPVFIERIATFGDIQTDYNFDSPSGRIEIWKRGYKNFLQHPITGVGTQQFNTADGLSPERIGSPDQRWATAHNMVVQIAVELGAIGIIAYLAMYGTTYLAARRVRKLARKGHASEELADIAEALQLSLVGFFVAGTFLSAGYSPVTMTLAAFGMIFCRLATEARAGPPIALVPELRPRARGALARRHA